MLNIDQSHAWFSLWPIISNKYKCFCKLWLHTTDKADVWSFIWMFMLSLLQERSEEVVLQGHPSSTAQVPHWQKQFPPSPLSSQLFSLWSETFPFSALLYLLSVYSLCLSSTSISQLLKCPVPGEFILLVNLWEIILSGFFVFPSLSV